MAGVVAGAAAMQNIRLSQPVNLGPLPRVAALYEVRPFDSRQAAEFVAEIAQALSFDLGCGRFCEHQRVVELPLE